MKKLIWIAFDLGVRGDYEGIYEFLDSHAAKECCDSLASLNYDYKKDLIAELKKELGSAVKLDRRSRLYVIFPDEKGSYRGRFIAGGRKQAPWTGYGAVNLGEEDTGE
jgi:hypothetical protein